MGFEDEAEQSFGRPCDRLMAGPSGHPIGFGFALSCCGSFLPGPTEFGAVSPDAVHDYGQPARQRHDCLLHPAAPGDLHRPGLEPGPLCRTHQQDLRCFVEHDRIISSPHKRSTQNLQLSTTTPADYPIFRG